MIQHAKHEFVGEQVGNSLAEWLNEKGHRADREKIVKLVAAIKGWDMALEQDVHAAFRKAENDMRKAGKRSFAVGDRLPVGHQYRKMLRRVDRLLSDCWMRPQLDLHGTRSTFIWKYQKPRAKGAHLLIQLMELGVVDRIRTCAREGCGKWLFVTYPTKRYCSDECQRRDYQTSEEWKRRRRIRYRARKERHGGVQ